MGRLPKKVTSPFKCNLSFKFQKRFQMYFVYIFLKFGITGKQADKFHCMVLYLFEVWISDNKQADKLLFMVIPG